MHSPSIRVVLVDDHALVRQGFRRILEDDPDLTVVGEASNGTDAIALVKKTDPDVVVMDMAMPEMSGLHATMEIIKQRPGTKVLILSMYPEDTYAVRALNSTNAESAARTVEVHTVDLRLSVNETGGTVRPPTGRCLHSLPT